MMKSRRSEQRVIPTNPPLWPGAARIPSRGGQGARPFRYGGRAGAFRAWDGAVGCPECTRVIRQR
jgi:hypothetical protein